MQMIFTLSIYLFLGIIFMLFIRWGIKHEAKKESLKIKKYIEEQINYFEKCKKVNEIEKLENNVIFYDGTLKILEDLKNRFF